MTMSLTIYLFTSKFGGFVSNVVTTEGLLFSKSQQLFKTEIFCLDI